MGKTIEDEQSVHNDPDGEQALLKMIRAYMQEIQQREKNGEDISEARFSLFYSSRYPGILSKWKITAYTILLFLFALS